MANGKSAVEKLTRQVVQHNGSEVEAYLKDDFSEAKNTVMYDKDKGRQVKAYEGIAVAEGFSLEDKPFGKVKVRFAKSKGDFTDDEGQKCCQNVAEFDGVFDLSNVSIETLAASYIDRASHDFNCGIDSAGNVINWPTGTVDLSTFIGSGGNGGSGGASEAVKLTAKAKREKVAKEMTEAGADAAAIRAATAEFTVAWVKAQIAAGNKGVKAVHDKFAKAEETPDDF